MVVLKNDYCYISHPLVLKRLNDLGSEFNAGYGLDKHCERAKNLILKLCDSPSSDVHFLTGGTITNKVMISHILKPFEAVISVDSGHINVHETGTIEQSGHKILTVENNQGKIDLEKVKVLLEEHNNFHMVKPKMIYISNPTEFGTIYSLEEIKNIYEFCQKNSLYFFIDGARLGCGLTCEENDVYLKDLARFTDCFYIGGTKNGAMLGEALVVNNQELNKDLKFSIKHYGGLYAKSFITGVQFEVLFENNLFFEIGRRQNQLANKLKNALRSLGIVLFNENPTNQVFAYFNEEHANKILKVIDCEIFIKEHNKIIIRFVTNFFNTESEIDQAINQIKNIIEDN